ncbi:hypothetical protein ERS044132_00624 [Streptococcus pneumoniae]|nr:hypothetical protein ERS044086_00523 [Streptococcus pneumoniae]CTJ01271.1 hypothetical protein ERS044132_00624 [Streptococcus pneumoniae]
MCQEKNLTDYKFLKVFRNLLELGNKCLKDAIREYYFRKIL